MEDLSKERSMTAIRMVILDFDGTLADTAAVIIRHRPQSANWDSPHVQMSSAQP